MASPTAPSHLDPLSLLERCTSYKHLTQIHANIIKSPQSHLTPKNKNKNKKTHHLLATNLLRLYATYGKIKQARKIFNQIKNPPAFTWNILIRAHTNNGYPKEALFLFNLMLCSNVVPDKFTFPFVMKACGASLDDQRGRMVHAFAVKKGYFGNDVYVKSTLLDMYLKCGRLRCAEKVFDGMSVKNVVSWTIMLSGFVALGEVDAAREVFDRMPVRNVVSWSVMINGYVASGRAGEALELFSEMQAAGVMPNEFTLVSLIRACTELDSVSLGAWVHDNALKIGVKFNVFLGTALVDMYSKCGSLVEAREVFDMMEERSLATWNSMITSLGVHGCGEEALDVFKQMLKENVMPDAITFVGVLTACVQTGKVDEGLRYFKYMTEVCGILPILEHYVCMFQIWDLAKTRAERENLSMEQWSKSPFSVYRQ